MGGSGKGIPPALRRHLPLTREAGSGRASIHPYAVRTVENGNRKSQPRADGKLCSRGGWWEHGLPELAQQLTEACGPGMPGPYGGLKIYGRQWYRNPSGAAAPPPFDKGGRERRGKRIHLCAVRTVESGNRKSQPRVRRTAGQKQPRGLFLGRVRFTFPAPFAME